MSNSCGLDQEFLNMISHYSAKEVTKSTHRMIDPVLSYF